MADRNPTHDRVHLSPAEVTALAGLEEACAARTREERRWRHRPITRAARLWCQGIGLERRLAARGMRLVLVALGVALASVAPPLVGLSAAALLLVVGATTAASRHRHRLPRSSRRARPRREAPPGGRPLLPCWWSRLNA